MEGDNFPHELIRAPYVAAMNQGLSVEDRLNHLTEEIESSDLVEL
jgi:hypothetical protein